MSKKTITVFRSEELLQKQEFDTHHKVLVAVGGEDMDASDGYHTFKELYEHRIALYIALCKKVHEMDEVHCAVSGIHKSVYPHFRVWRSTTHSDGSVMEGWFVLGIGKKQGEQITYHLPLDEWAECDFAETLEKAPEWDEHTSDDVLERLISLL